MSDEFYRLFLDEDLQYTCAYYSSPDDTLEEAQLNKKRHIVAKLKIEDGMKIYTIKVSPNAIGNALVTGEMEIIDSLWCGSGCGRSPRSSDGRRGPGL